MRHLLRALLTTLTLTASLLPRAHSEELTIISPHWEGIRYEFEQAFSEQHQQQHGTPVTIRWLDVGGTSEILRYVRSEYARQPDGIGIDLLFGGGIDPFLELKRAGLLQRSRLELPPEVAQEVAGTPLHDPEGHFFAPTMSIFGIICNQDVLARLHLSPPQSWTELGNPALKSWVGSGDPRRSGSTHMAYEIMLQAYGWDRGWQVLYRMGANIRSFAANSLQVSKDVGNGEIACGLAIDSQASSQIKTFGSEKLTFIVPQGLTVINGDSIALLKGAPHRSLAIEFLKFLFSEKGQSLWLRPVGAAGGPRSYELARAAVMPHLYQGAPLAGLGINPFEQRTSLRYDSHLGSARWGLLNDLIGVFIVDGQEMLRERIPPAPPVPEAELTALLQRVRELSPRQRAHLVHSWEMAARQDTGSTVWRKLLPAVLLALATLMIGIISRYRRSQRATYSG